MNATLAQLPVAMQAEVAMGLYENVLRKAKVFEGSEEAFLREISLKIRPLVALPENFIFHYGDCGREMFVVARGLLEVLSPDMSTVWDTLAVGRLFGESVMFDRGARRKAHVKALTRAELCRIKRRDFEEIMDMFPGEAERIKMEWKRQAEVYQAQTTRKSRLEMQEMTSEKRDTRTSNVQPSSESPTKFFTSKEGEVETLAGISAKGSPSGERSRRMRAGTALTNISQRLNYLNATVEGNSARNILIEGMLERIISALQSYGVNVPPATNVASSQDTQMSNNKGSLSLLRQVPASGGANTDTARSYLGVPNVSDEVSGVDNSEVDTLLNGFRLSEEDTK